MQIRNLLGLAGAGVAVIAVLVVCVGLWGIVGTSDISAAGWVAMACGVIASLALGIGLMALVFISNRRGYDELDRRSR